MIEQRKMGLPSILDYSTDNANEVGRGHFKSHISGSDSTSRQDGKSKSRSPRAKRMYSVPRSVKNTLQPVSVKDSGPATNMNTTATSQTVNVQKPSRYISQPPPERAIPAMQGIR